MKPILYPENERTFDTNGIGILADAISCLVTETRNGEFELEMEYPIDGIHYADIIDRSIILAKPNPTSRPQPFRVYFQSAPMDGNVRFLARHVSYDLAGVPVDPFSADSAPDAMVRLAEHAVFDAGFTFWTDIGTAAPMETSQPMPMRSILGGTKGGILDTYGGEYEFDRYAVKLHASRGRNRGVSIRYGKNLTDILQERNCANVYTGVYPYWKSQEGKLVLLQEKIVAAPGVYSFSKILVLDATAAFQEEPTEDQLRNYTKRYISDNNIGVPDVSISLSFAALEQTEEYKGLVLLESVALCDVVSVEFPKLGVSATAKCVRTLYDCLLERYERIDVGSVRANIADTIVNQQHAIVKVQDPSFLQSAVNAQTQEFIFNKLTNNGAEQGVYLADGKIYINASYLKAGIIEGIEIIGEKGSIAGFDMSANTLSAKWRKDFPEFTQEDLQIIADVYMNWSTYTAEEQAAYLERYDVNMDGRINASDAVVISGMIEGRHPNYTEGQITIDASSPKACIVLEVTGGFRAGQKLVLGLGFVRASSVEADSFSCSGSQGYTGEVTVGGSVLTIKGGIITAVT